MFQQVVALRLLPERSAADADVATLLLEQARVVSRIEHPNVGRILDVEDRAPAYIAMEWLEGESLDRIALAAREGRGLTLEWMLHVMGCVLAGLHAAHEGLDAEGRPIRLVHREVAPENVIVTFDGQVKVVDFGVPASRHRQAVTRILGTGTPYFSPEQVRGQDIDRRSDVFSAGALLYFLLTGVHPFEQRERTSIHQALEWIAEGDLVPPSKHVPEVPAAVDAIVAKALAKDPNARFQTALDLKHALEELDDARSHPTEQEVAELVRGLFPGAAEALTGVVASAMRRLDAVADVRSSAAPAAASEPVPEDEPERAAEPEPGRPFVETGPPRAAETPPPRPPHLPSRGDLAFGFGAAAAVCLVALFTRDAPPDGGADPRGAGPPAQGATGSPAPSTSSSGEPTVSPAPRPGGRATPRRAPTKRFVPKGL